MFREFLISSKFPPVRANRVILGTYLGFLVFRDRLGVLFNLAVEPVVTLASPLTGTIISARPMVSEETIYLTPAGTLAALTFTLPSAANARIGQKRRLITSQIITALTVNVDGSGVTAGAALTAAAVNTTYEWQYVQVTGTVATWLRLP
ncbi:hypothetical protein JIN84_17815 [Luteolibacter yonseiensis]|uniref:Uncharacterized protein n=1 Tax=Luteolibacter yonseiensis TaxID=1144680 RepID=A0A934R5R1_9BACT|nr:hypothetical protein [Luteolibacter yonseiensis]MBK1817482.1 hypothetical protein [Luteolibacter yonseiensis]